MKSILFILFFLQFIFLNAQIENNKEIPKYELTYENIIFNRESMSHETVIFSGETPNMSYEFNFNNKTFLVAFFLSYEHPSIIGTYVRFANTWQLIHQMALESEEIYKGLKFLNTESSKFVYFDSKYSPGSSNVGTHIFSLYDILNNELHRLEYVGQANFEKDFMRISDNGKFEFKNLNNHLDILSVLEKEAMNSKYIVRK